MRKDVEAFLRSLGSTASEVKVFMALFRAKRYLSVRDLEERINLSAKSIRIALKRLKEKGVVVTREKNGRKLYRSVSLKEIVEIWKRKVENTLSHLFRRP